jgi:hypothetical protein
MIYSRLQKPGETHRKGSIGRTTLKTMLTKDDRQAKSILAALHDLTSALQSSHYQQERGVSAQPKPEISSFVVGVKESMDALIYESKTQAEETRTFQRRSLRIQWLLFLATAAAFIAVGIYANIARLQETTMDATLGQIQKQVVAAEVANNLAKRSLQSAIDAERPWVGITFRIQDWTIGKNASAIAMVTNNGRRPAKVTRVQLDNNQYAAFPDTPRYRRNIKNSILILPNGSLTNTQPLGVVTQSELDDLGLRRRAFFIYASVDYEDVLTHAAHWTRGCLQYLPGVQNAASRFVKCSTYNDVDEERSPSNE